MNDLLQSIASKLTEAGWELRSSGQGLQAKKEVILSSWFLGSSRVVHKLRLECDDAARKLSLSETAVETTRGMPPPRLSVTTFKQRGLAVSETRKDSSPFGGGKLDYGAPRQWIEQECAAAGWAFTLRLI